MKFHVEHFTCSICPTVFGPQDSYYEHDGKVFCHFHYSTRFAIPCTGCRTAILKQFVEINRNNVDEHWHPECYMIHKVSLWSWGFSRWMSADRLLPLLAVLEHQAVSDWHDASRRRGDRANREPLRAESIQLWRRTRQLSVSRRCTLC